MILQFSLYALPSVFATVLSLVVGRAAWRRRPAPGAVPLVLLMVSVIVWSVADFLKLVFPTYSAMYLLMQLEQPGVVGIPVFWAIFALDYADLRRWLSRRNLVLLGILEVAILLVAFTNPWTGWLWPNPTLNLAGPYPFLGGGRGPWWWVNVLVNYPLIVLGTLVIGWTLLDSRALYRRQAGVVLAGVLVTWVTNILVVLQITPDYLNLMPLAFSLGGVCFWWGFFRLHMLDLMPVARAKVFESLADAVIVLDPQNRIADLNPAAQKLMGLAAAQGVGQAAESCLRVWPALVERFGAAPEAKGEVQLTVDDIPCSFDLRLSPLTHESGRLTGRLLVLRDITDRKRAEDEVRHLNAHLEDQVQERTQQLSAANARLQALSRQLVETQENERRRVALDLHDELGQILNSVKLSLDQMAGLPPPQAQQHLERVTGLIGDLIQRVRELALSLRPTLLDDLGLAAALKSLCRRHSAAGGPAVIFHDALADSRRFPPPVETTVYRIAQEGVTNALRHARSETVSVTLRTEAKDLLLEICDTGTGFVPDEALSGPTRSTGLSGMRERARLLGGELRIDSAPGGGTRLTARLPLAETPLG